MRTHVSTAVDDAALAPLTAVIDEQIHCAETLLTTLEREAQALERGDIDALNGAGADKVKLVEALDALERERRALTALASPSVRLSLDDRWRRLLSLTERMKAEKARNGAHVDARRRRVLAALKLLRGV